MKHHIIYVPGITDDTFHVQSILIQSWRLRGIVPHLHAMPWSGGEKFELKLAKLLAQIDKLHGKGYIISLVGASAGASAVLHAYAERKNKVAGLVYICGKINHAETVSDRTYSQNPAFKDSLYSLAQILAKLISQDKNKMLSLYSTKDGTVPYHDTIIDGVRGMTLPAIRHGWAIVYALSFGSGRMISFLKRSAKQM